MFRNSVGPKEVRPVGTHILLKRHAAHEQIGLIFTPEDRIERNLKCTVIATGKGRWFPNKGYIPSQFKPGMVVILRQWRGRLLNPHDESVIFVTDDLVEGILPNEAPVDV